MKNIVIVTVIKRVFADEVVNIEQPQQLTKEELNNRPDGLTEADFWDGDCSQSE